MVGTRDLIGWREWVFLPNLDIGPIKAKIDTGAKTSALHAYDIKIDGAEVSFKVHTIQGRDDFVIAAKCPLVDQRVVRDSGGKETLRPIVLTPLRVNGKQMDVELSLVDRQDMGFRMLIGRTALEGNFLVDCQASYLGGVPEQISNWRRQP